MVVICQGCGKRFNVAAAPVDPFRCRHCRDAPAAPRRKSSLAERLGAHAAELREAKRLDSKMILPVFCVAGLLCFGAGFVLTSAAERKVETLGAFIVGALLFIVFLAYTYGFKIAGSAINPRYTPTWKCGAIAACLFVVEVGLTAALARVREDGGMVFLVSIAVRFIALTTLVILFLRMSYGRSLLMALVGLVFVSMLMFLLLIAIAGVLMAFLAGRA